MCLHGAMLILAMTQRSCRTLCAPQVCFPDAAKTYYKSNLFAPIPAEEPRAGAASPDSVFDQLRASPLQWQGGGAFPP